MAYKFTCPLDGCDHKVMTSNADDEEMAANELAATAQQHLSEMHPEVKKSPDEVSMDIRVHMVKNG